jgi:hypothetical protein
MVARRRAVILEAIQEYVWRLLIDWPLAMGHAGEIESVAATRRAVAPALTALSARARRVDGDPDVHGDCDASFVAKSLALLAGKHVYGMPPDVWLASNDADAISAWARNGKTGPARLQDELLTRAPDLARSDTALMPSLRREALTTVVVPALRGDPAFAQAPSWGGSPVETGALARVGSHPFVSAIRARCGNAVSSRFAARLTELALLLGRLAGAMHDDSPAPWVDAFALGKDEGLSAVQTARGLLLHHAVLNEGRVDAYRIVAPTEWNFHPAGALVRGLSTLSANDVPQLVRQAHLAVQALDPCVACGVEVAHA